MSWIRDKKFRITDFFRRQDKRGEGMLIRQQFVEGMMTSSMSHMFYTVHSHSLRTQTNRSELLAHNNQ